MIEEEPKGNTMKWLEPKLFSCGTCDIPIRSIEKLADVKCPMCNGNDIWEAVKRLA